MGMSVMAATYAIDRPSAVGGIEALYEAHRLKVYRWALRYGGGSRAFADDLTKTSS
jgi:hypothetical protein